ncbi:MAG: PEP-CTERM sorting domain-containing protein [Terriglobia bacterium]
MIKGLYAGFIGLFVFAGIAAADLAPLPGSVLNSSGVQTNTTVSVLDGTYPVGFNFGYGGGFTASIDAIDTVIWCVDAEEDITLPTHYQADLVQLSQIGSNTNDVRYGTVTSGWQLDLSGADAQQRYEMAAYLIDKYYPGVSASAGTVAGPTQPANLMDQEIQTAIWELLWNSSVSPQGGITWPDIQSGSKTSTPLFNPTDMTAITGYINDAQTWVSANPTASLFDNYAVVSGSLNSDGTLHSPGIQTYLVQLTPVPEPASVILLASLLVAAFALVRRTRTKRARHIS